MEHYDFVVVGAGTAGCVIASRLAERTDAQVLLLESGTALTSDQVRDPQAWPTLGDTAASWGESTVVQAATGKTVPYPRGRGLGGSSSINAMLFARGHRSSYDAWAGLGVPGWGFDDRLPYFRRSETAAGRDPELRGTDGPLQVGPGTPATHSSKPARRRPPNSATGKPATSAAGWNTASGVSTRTSSAAAGRAPRMLTWPARRRGLTCVW